MSSTKREKLFVLCPSLVDSPGGIQRYCLDIYKALHEDNCSPITRFYTKLDKQTSLINFTRTWGAGSVPGFLRTIIFAMRIIFDALQYRPTAILVLHLNFAPVAWALKLLLRTRYAVALYGIEAWEIKSSFRKKALQQADLLWPISQATMERATRHRGLNATRCRILPCAIDTEKFHFATKSEALIRKFGLTAGSKVILTVARLSDAEKYKGYDFLVRALPSLKEQLSDLRYILVGTGSDRQRIEQLAKELGVSDIVNFVGYVADEQLVDYYNLCDVFALPGNGEGFGIVFLEALCCGKPCIGGAADGSRDPLQDGELGILVEYGNIEALSDALYRLLSGNDVAPNLLDATHLRERTIQSFGFKRFAERLNQERIPELCAE